ncbi:MAG: hypothetical protein ACP5IL_11895 [Syntrophobacteraceae bacterium]
MRKLNMVLSSAVLFLTIFSASVVFAQRGGINQRIGRQWHHIEHALRYGRLTPHQAHFLRRNLGHIRHEFEMARATGTLDPGKIRWLNEKLDHNRMRMERMEHGAGGGFEYGQHEHYY